jgi:16S rRNA (uracil1498-N3)-methyltransferase
MPPADITHARLFVDATLGIGQSLALDKAQQNYLANVLRLKAADRILLFNGRDGEFSARLSGEAKRLTLTVDRQTRPQAPAPALRWLFAPLKHARLDYMVQKAVEMGVGSLEPVITRRTQVGRVNLDRMVANVIEAAEQCGIIAVPTVQPEVPLQQVLERWDGATRLVFCDEEAPLSDPLAALAADADKPIAVLIGPEGGFEESERAALLSIPAVTRLTLGPRILRADTAAVAALALVQAVSGDWRAKR